MSENLKRKVENKTNETEIPKEIKKELSKYTKIAESFFEEITGKKINSKPEIRINSEGLASFVSGNEIWITKADIDTYHLNPNSLKINFYSCYFLWAISHANKELESRFEEIPNPNTHRFAFLLRIASRNSSFEKNSKLLFYSNDINLILVPTADLFAYTLASKNESEILKEMSHAISISPLDVRKVYKALERVNGKITEHDLVEIAKIVSKLGSSERSNISIEELMKFNNFADDISYIREQIHAGLSEAQGIYEMGEIIIFFAYELYKKEGKNVKQLLRDLTLTPWDVVEKVVEEIQKDETENLLKTAISDLRSTRWEKLLRRYPDHTLPPD
jgi:hypothetical protein